MKYIRVGLIGLGGVSEAHLNAYLAVPEVRVTAGAEPREQRMQSMAKKWGFRGYTDYKEMLKNEELDLACILVPALLHREVAEYAAGCHVNILCEKPLSHNLEDAETILASCKKNGVKLFYGATYRSLPACMKAKEMIDAGRIGDVTFMSESILGGGGLEKFNDLGPHHYPRGGPGGGGLGLVDHGIHLVDLFRWFASSEITSVSGRGNYSGGIPATEFMTMQFANGAVGQLVYNEATVSSDMPGEGIFSMGSSWNWDGSMLSAGTWHSNPPNIRVHGTHGALRIYPYANKLYWMTPGKTEEVRDVAERPAPGNFAIQMEGIVEALRSGSEPPITGQDGFKALEAVLAAYKSYEKREVVQFADCKK